MENEKVINNSENKASSSRVKGKEKEIINVSEITQKLDWVIEKNKERYLTIFNSKSEKDLEKLMGESKENKLYHMKPKTRQELAKSFSGLDRILFDKLVSKIGSKQIGTGALTAGHVAGALSAGGGSLISLIPVVGNIAGAAANIASSTTATMALKNLNNAKIELEKTFSIKEVKEIVSELGILGGIKGLGELKKIKVMIEDRENGLLNQINDLEKKVKEANEKAEKLNKTIQEKEKEEAEKKEQQKKLLETQNQLHSPEKVNLETLKEKHRKLEEKAKTNEEILAAWKIKLDDYKLAIEQLKKEREIEEREKSRFLQLYINETDLHSITKDKILGKEIEIGKLEIEWNSTKRQLETAINAASVQTDRLETSQQERLEWEGRAKIAENKVQNLEHADQILRKELRELEKKVSPGITDWIAKKTGFNYAKDIFFGAIIIVIILVFLFVFSYCWKWLIKPTIKNFQSKEKQPWK